MVTHSSTAEGGARGEIAVLVPLPLCKQQQLLADTANQNGFLRTVLTWQTGFTPVGHTGRLS